MCAWRKFPYRVWWKWNIEYLRICTRCRVVKLMFRIITPVLVVHFTETLQNFKLKIETAYIVLYPQLVTDVRSPPPQALTSIWVLSDNMLMHDLATAHITFEHKWFTPVDSSSSNSTWKAQWIPLFTLNCDYVASNKAKVNFHTKAVHEKVGYLKCTFCDFSSSQRVNMNVHIKAIHEKKKDVYCLCCDYAASTNILVNMHTKVVHENIFCVKICNIHPKLHICCTRPHIMHMIST